MWHVCGTRRRHGAARGRRLGIGGPARHVFLVRRVLLAGARLPTGWAAGRCRRLMQLAEPQNGREGFVDPPLLVWADPAHQIAQPSGIDRADLLN